MKTKKSSYAPMNIGISLMLVVFIILCMVIFAVLSLSSAQKDYQYSIQTAKRTAAYYEACNRAEEIRAEFEIDESLEDVIEFSVPIDDNEILCVTLTRKPDENSGYYISSWVQDSTDEWTGKSTLPVLGSE